MAGGIQGGIRKHNYKSRAELDPSFNVERVLHT